MWDSNQAWEALATELSDPSYEMISGLCHELTILWVRKQIAWDTYDFMKKQIMAFTLKKPSAERPCGYLYPRGTHRRERIEIARSMIINEENCTLEPVGWDGENYKFLVQPFKLSIIVVRPRLTEDHDDEGHAYLHTDFDGCVLQSPLPPLDLDDLIHVELKTILNAES